MEKTIEYKDFEDMKLQLDTLRRKLEQQDLVNDKMIRQAMRNRFSPVMRNKTMGICACIFAMPYCFWALRFYMELSWAFTAFTEIFLLAGLVWTIVSYMHIKSSDFINDSLVNVKKKVLQLKLNDRRWKFIAFPFLAVFFAWFFIHLTVKYGFDSFSAGGLVGMVSGFVAGGLMMRNYNRAMNEVIKELEELTAEK